VFLDYQRGFVETGVVDDVFCEPQHSIAIVKKEPFCGFFFSS
jgi:hypothetical protein